MIFAYYAYFDDGTRIGSGTLRENNIREVYDTGRYLIEVRMRNQIKAENVKRKLAELHRIEKERYGLAEDD